MRRVNTDLKDTQKHSAGLISRTEKSLAGKAGHLEMLKGGKTKAGGAGGGGEGVKQGGRGTGIVKEGGK